MNTSRSLKNDVIVWALIMCCAATIAFVLLRRDSQRRFGAVSYGAFPAFDSKTASGDVFNAHALKAMYGRYCVLRQPDHKQY